MDRETEKILSDQEKIANLVQSDGWAVIRKRLVDLLVDNSSVLEIEGDANEILKEVGMRQGVFGIISKWLTEIEGAPKNTAAMSEMFRDKVETDFIQRFN